MTQGVLCDLIKRSFEDFVQAAMNSENFLSKPGSSGDAAKAQSWMSSLEFKRIALSNEIQLQGGRAKYVTLSVEKIIQPNCCSYDKIDGTCRVMLL